MNETSKFEKKDVDAATAGADVYYRSAAKETVAQVENDMPLKDLINIYCSDVEFAEKQVADYLASLPANDELVMRSFELYELLRSSRNALQNIVGLDAALLAEAARGKKNKAVDDDKIRRSAGYTNDEEVADNAKTDAARDKGITDEDIAKEVADDISYQDQTIASSPYFTFREQTRKLCNGIIDHCLTSGDVHLLEEAKLLDECDTPAELSGQIKKLCRRLEPPRDEDK